MTRAGQQFSTLVSGKGFRGIRGVKIKNADPIDSDHKFNQVIERYSKAGLKKDVGRDKGSEDNKSSSKNRFQKYKQQRKGDKSGNSNKSNHLNEKSLLNNNALVSDIGDIANPNRAHGSLKRKYKETDENSKFLYSLADDASTSSGSDSELEFENEMDKEEFPFIDYLHKFKPSLANDIHLLHPSWYEKLYKEMQEIYITEQNLLKRKKENYSLKKKATRRRKLENKRRKLEEETNKNESQSSNSEQKYYNSKTIINNEKTNQTINNEEIIPT